MAALNVLILRNQLAMPPSVFQVSAEELLQKLNNLLLDLHASALEAEDARSQQLRQSLMSYLELLPGLGGEVVADVRFTGPKEFELKLELFVFQLLDIALVHGWLVSEEDPAAFAAAAPFSASALERRVADAPEESSAARDFFVSSSPSQLTLEGIIRLHDALQDRELAVLYRHGQFRTLLKHRDELYLLCGGSEHFYSHVVWERLVAKDAEILFFDETFRALHEQSGSAQARGSASDEASLVAAAAAEVQRGTAEKTCSECGAVSRFPTPAPGELGPANCASCGSAFEI